MFRTILFLSILPLLQAQSSNLNIYWADVEGGGATLLVTPGGESLLVDTGNPAPGDRDAKRIYELTQQAGLKKIDFLLITHFHGDHVGGIEALSKMIPIERFFDHGDSVETTNPRDAKNWETYKTISMGKRTIVKPGDKIPIEGLQVVVVSSNGEVLANPINGGGPNPFCRGAEQKPPDTTENQRSAGILVTFGKFKFLDLGDLTWDKEMELACPVNKLGTVTIFQASHHGFYRDYSGAPAFVWAIKPQVVVVNNGPAKGWQANAYDTVQKISGLEGVWQLHRRLDTDAAHNTKRGYDRQHGADQRVPGAFAQSLDRSRRQLHHH